MDLRMGKHVEEITGEGGVEGIIPVGKSRGVCLAEATAPVRNLGQPPLCASKHSRSEVNGLGPAAGVGVEEGWQGESGTRSDVQHLLVVLYRKPLPAGSPSRAGDERDDLVVNRSDDSVGRSQN